MKEIWISSNSDLVNSLDNQLAFKIMKNTMCGLIVILLTVMGLATARSLPITSSQQATGEIGRLGRREADSTSQIDNADPMLNEFMAELANLSIPSYLKDLFINLTLSNETDNLSDKAKVNTIRSYENQAKSKLICILAYARYVGSYIAI